MTIFVTIYTHRHGTDAWANKSREGAIVALADVVAENADDVDDDGLESKIRKAVEKGQLKKAIDLYFGQGRQDESYEIRDVELQD